MSVALVALIVNYTARFLAPKLKLQELHIKLASLIVVVVCVALLMIFGK